VTLAALLARLGWQRRKRTGPTAKERLLSLVAREKAAEVVAREAEAERNKPPPTPEQLIENGTLKILDPVEKPLPKPARASFSLPPGGEGYHRIAGLAYDPTHTLYAMVQLLPTDAFWLDPHRFPSGMWRTVRMAGEPTRVQRIGRELCIENPQQGGDPGCWMPLKFG